MRPHRLPLLPSLATLLLAGALGACSKSVPPAATAAPAPAVAEVPAPTAQSNAAQSAALAAREADLARREAELAAREAKSAKAASAGSAPGKAAAKPHAAPDNKATVREVPPEVHEAPAPPGSVAVAPPPPPAPLVVRAGTPIHVTVTSEVSTKTARVGDPVDAQVAEPLIVDGRTAIEAGTLVRGTVSEVVSGSNKIGGTPTLALRFDGIELSPGKTVGINGSVRELGKSDTARDTAKIAGGALAGAILGKQIGDNKGRLIGGLLGAAAGTVVARKSGTEVELPAGSSFSVTLDAALTIYPR